MVMSAQDNQINATVFCVFENLLAYAPAFHETSRPARLVSCLFGSDSLQHAEKLLLLFRQEIRVSTRLGRDHVKHVI